MKALVFNRTLQIEEMAKPKTAEDEALIRVRMAGICNTDIEITRGYMGFRGVLGHEFVGDVVASDRDEWMGKRVVGDINLGCGECEYCRTGLRRHCPQRRVTGILDKDGAFAEFIAYPVTNLFTIPDSISDEEAVFIEPLAAACEILEQVHIEPTHRIAVVGDGKLGQLIARVLRLTGCRLTVYGMSERKLGLLGPLGIETILAESHRNDKYDVVVEASGSPSGFAKALELVKPRGVFHPEIHDARGHFCQYRSVGHR
jgi:alcohol dehydrogenase